MGWKAMPRGGRVWGCGCMERYLREGFGMMWRTCAVLVLVCGMALGDEGGKGIPPAKPGTSGSILCEYFRGIAGGSVADLTKSAAFPLNPTDGELSKAFEVPA